MASTSTNMEPINKLLETARNDLPAVGGPANDISQGELQKTLQFLTRDDGDLHNYIRYVPTFPPVPPAKSYATLEFIESGGEEGHMGIDIAADSGTPIRAAADGIVMSAGWKYDLGNEIIIFHGNGFMTVYGHNKLIYVSNREFVEKGQIIALLGNSGESTGPHLHFEIWKNLQPVNPRNYIVGY